MNKLKVLHFPDPRLRKVAQKVRNVDQNIRDIIDQMFFTMYEEKGIGLAATQVNIHKRIIVIDVSEKKDERICLINPVILSFLEIRFAPCLRNLSVLPQNPSSSFPSLTSFFSLTLTVFDTFVSEDLFN